MTSREGAAIIEAILFAMGDSVEINTLSKAMEISVREVKDHIDYLKNKYEQDDSGIGLIELENAIQLCTKKEMYEYLVKIAKDVWKYDLGKKVSDIKSIDLYVKPFENKAYYVINAGTKGQEDGDFDY